MENITFLNAQKSIFGNKRPKQPTAYVCGQKLVYEGQSMHMQTQSNVRSQGLRSMEKASFLQ